MQKIYLKKKKEEIVEIFRYYGRFLSIKSPTIAIAIIMAIVLPMMYISVGGRAVTGAGEAVGAGWSTANAVTACEGQ